MYLAGRILVASLVCFATLVFHVAADAFLPGNYTPRHKPHLQPNHSSIDEASKRSYRSPKPVWPVDVPTALSHRTLKTRYLKGVYSAIRVKDSNFYEIMIDGIWDELGGSITYKWVGVLEIGEGSLGKGANGEIKKGTWYPYERARVDIMPDTTEREKEILKISESCSIPHVPVAVKQTKQAGGVRGAMIAQALSRNPFVVGVKQYAFLQKEGEDYSLVAYELLDEAADDLLRSGKKINAMTIVKSMLSAQIYAVKKIKLFNIDMTLANIMTTIVSEENKAKRDQEPSWKIIDWDLSFADETQDTPAGTPEYYAPEVYASYANLGEKSPNHELAKFVRKTLGVRSPLPEWKPVTAGIWPIGMSFLYSLGVQYEGKVTTVMEEMAAAFSKERLPKTSPIWYWYALVHADMTGKEIPGNILPEGLDDREKTFLKNVLCKPEKRWTYREAWDYLFPDDPDDPEYLHG